MLLPLLQNLTLIPLTLLTLHRPGVAEVLQDGPSETLREAWVGALELGPNHIWMQLRILEGEDGTISAYFDSITEGRKNFPAEWSVEEGSLHFFVPSIHATYVGELNESQDRATGHFEQGGRRFELDLERRETAYQDSTISWSNRPQRPRGPFPYTSEKVLFQNAGQGVRLAGTLTVPKTPGPHPAVILISGSGPQDRDETFMEHKPFLVLADFLSRRGIAVLRYDDRGTNASTGEFEGATSEDFASDVDAAIDFLKGLPRLDSSRIGLVGHSEGGLIAPIVAAERDDVALIVLLAGTGVTGDRVSLSQTSAMMRAAGSDEAEIQMVEAVQRAALSVIQSAEPGSEVKDDILVAVAEAISGLPEDSQVLAAKERETFVRNLPTRFDPWLHFFLSYDPAGNLRRVRCPVLALNGSNDLQVLPRLNLPAIGSALAYGQTRDYQVLELPGLNHLFQACDTGSMDEYLSIPETMNPVALETIGDWLGRHFGLLP